MELGAAAAPGCGCCRAPIPIDFIILVYQGSAERVLRNEGPHLRR